MDLKKYKIPILECLAALVPVIAKPTIDSVNLNTSYAINNWFPPIMSGGETPKNYTVRFENLFPWVASNKLMGMRYSNDTTSYVLFEINTITKVTTLFRDLENRIPNRLCGLAFSDGIIWFYGGIDKSTGTYSNTLYSYNLASDTVTNHGSSGLARASSCGCCVGDKVTFLGGQLSNYAYANQTTTFTISTSAFVNVSTGLPAPRTGGRMIACNGKGYQIGANYIDSWLNGGKFYEWDPAANTWTQYGYLDTNYTMQNLFPFVYNNEVYVASNNTSTVVDAKPIEVFKYVPGTGLVAAMGIGVTTPEFNTQNHKINMLVSACELNDVIYFVADNDISVPAGEPIYDIYGTMSIENNSITPILYQISTVSLSFNISKEVITVVADTIELLEVSKGLMVSGPTVTGTTELLASLSSLEGIHRYWYDLTMPINSTFTFDATTEWLMVRYKGTKGEYSPWSNVYMQGGE